MAKIRRASRASAGTVLVACWPHSEAWDSTSAPLSWFGDSNDSLDLKSCSASVFGPTLCWVKRSGERALSRASRVEERRTALGGGTMFSPTHFGPSGCE